MCSPHVMEHVSQKLSRRDLLRLAAGAAVAMTAFPGRGMAQLLDKPEREFTFSRVADLTHPLSPQFPVFPTDEPMKMTPQATIEEDGFYANKWELGEHTGTHLDAPAHFVERAGILTAEQIRPVDLVAPLVVLDITGKARRDHDAQVAIDDILAYERRYGRIPAGAAVCMYSGWEERVGNGDAFLNQDAGGTMHFPGFGPEAAEFLVNERDIVGIGVDTLSLDFGPSEDFATHLTVLGQNKWGLESLAGLANVPPYSAMLVVGAPKVVGASGGPSRVLALW